MQIITRRGDFFEKFRFYRTGCFAKGIRPPRARAGGASARDIFYMRYAVCFGEQFVGGIAVRRGFLRGGRK